MKAETPKRTDGKSITSAEALAHRVFGPLYRATGRPHNLEEVPAVPRTNRKPYYIGQGGEPPSANLYRILRHR